MREGVVGPRVVAVGLGPAGPELTTPAADRAIRSGARVFLRTARHPASRPYAESGIASFDRLYEAGERFEEVYRAIVDELVEAARASGSVVYAVPGSPSVLEATVRRLRADGRVVLETIAGLSFLDLCWERLGTDPVQEGVALVDGERFGIAASVSTGPLLVAQTWSRAILSEMKCSVEPEAHQRAVLLHHLGLADEVVEEVAWEDLDRVLEPDHLTCVFVPGLSRPPAYEMARALAVVEELRVRCPWDASQTHRSLVRHLLEETYEAIEAIEQLGDPPELEASALLEEELGDVLCQVLFHATLAREEGLFSMADVARTLADKLVFRHPHVYEDAAERGIDDVLAGWERRKLEEKGRSSLTEGIPEALPALAYAAKLERKAHSAGIGLFDIGPNPDEARDAPAHGALRPGALGPGALGPGALGPGAEGAYGEVLLALARRAASDGVDPEAALRVATRRFRDRFRRYEALVARLDGATLVASDRIRLWAEAD